MLGYSIVLPFLVFLVNRFGGNAFIYGVLGSVYPAFQFFGAPLLGKWSDSYGRRKILLISQIGTFIAWIIFLAALYLPVNEILSIDSGTMGAFTITLPLVFLFIARALDGITGGNVSVANAYLSDVSSDENRKQNFGKMAMSTSLGFILGPMLAGLLGATQFQEIPPVLIAILISGICILLIYFMLPESKIAPVDPKILESPVKQAFSIEQKECYKMKNCQDTRLPSVFRIPHVPYMLVIYFLTFLGFSFFYASFPMHAIKLLKWNTLELGIFFSFMSGLMILVQGPVLSKLSIKYSDTTLVLSGSVILAISFALMPMGGGVVMYLAAVLFALGNGLMWPSYQAVLSKLGGDKQQGSVQGMANSSGSLASILGLILGGYFYGMIGPNIFLGAAAVMMIVFLASFRMRKVNA
jgi:DHA1 family tetracycline resistance protein-like MFS transporter